MSRQEFMEQLEKLLMDIPQEEREEALTYYNGYFEDAGEENEASIIQELESPEKVARIIKADVGAEEEIEYSESGYSDTRFRQQEEVGRREQTQGYRKGTPEGAHRAGGSDYSQSSGNSGYDFDSKKASPQEKDNSRTILLIILAVVTCPIWLGLLGGLFGLAVGAVATVCGLLLAAVIIVFVFYIVGVVFIGVGISMLAVGSIGISMGLFGVGCLMLAVGILGTVACVWLLGRFLPWMVRGIVSLCGRLFQRKGRMA